MTSHRVYPLFTVSALIFAAFQFMEAREPSTALMLIQSLSDYPHNARVVRVSSRPLGIWNDDESPTRVDSQLVVRLPAMIWIADSVEIVHIQVVGYNAVRVKIASRGDSVDFVTGHGRDLTFNRGPDGQFSRAWTVQPAPR